MHILKIIQDDIDFEQFLGLLSKYAWDLSQATEVIAPNQSQSHYEVYGKERQSLIELKGQLQQDYAHWQLEIEELSSQWQSAWKEHVQSFDVGENFHIQPAWQSHQRANAECKTIVRIDCTLSFGLGNHPTTQMMVQLLENSVKTGALLDIGTGTGILAIVGAHLGFDPIKAIDLCPEAIQSAGINIQQAPQPIQLEQCSLEDFSTKQTFDYICANLLSKDLIQQMQLLCNLLKPQGYLAISGISDQNVHTVRQAFTQSSLPLQELKHLNQETWNAFLLQDQRISY